MVPKSRQEDGRCGGCFKDDKMPTAGMQIATAIDAPLDQARPRRARSRSPRRGHTEYRDLVGRLHTNVEHIRREIENVRQDLNELNNHNP